MTPPLFEDRQPVEMCNLTPHFSYALFFYTFSLTLFCYTFSLTPFLLLFNLKPFSYTLFSYTLLLQPMQRSSSTAQHSLRVCFTAWLHFACIPSLQTSEYHCKPLPSIEYPCLPLHRDRQTNKLNCKQRCQVQFHIFERDKKWLHAFYIKATVVNSQTLVWKMHGNFSLIINPQKCESPINLTSIWWTITCP